MAAALLAEDDPATVGLPDCWNQAGYIASFLKSSLFIGGICDSLLQAAGF